MSGTVFVTVGTTSFDPLLQELDELAGSSDMKFTFQTGPSKYVPHNGSSMPFFENFLELYSASDIVVTHAGAGSVYTMLELGVYPIVVANLDRADKHQLDLVTYIKNNAFGVALTHVEEVKGAINRYHNYSFNAYSKTDFFVTPQLIEIISSTLRR